MPKNKLHVGSHGHGLLNYNFILMVDGYDCTLTSVVGVGASLWFTSCGAWVDSFSTSFCSGWVFRGPSVSCVGGGWSVRSAGCANSLASTSTTVFISSTGQSGQLFLLCPTWWHMLHFFLWPPLLIWVLSFLKSHSFNLLFFLGLPGKILLYGGWTSE